MSQALIDEAVAQATRALQDELAKAKKALAGKKNAQHSAKTFDHGSAPASVTFGRDVIGHDFDCDPASSGYWNHHLIKARTFYDVTQNGLDLRNAWFGDMWINPPGTVKDDEDQAEVIARHGGRSMPRLFWDRLIYEYNRGAVKSAIWYGFTLAQLRTLQTAPMAPHQFLTLIPATRLDCLTRGPGNGPPVPQGAPTHDSFITLIPSRDRSVARGQVSRFMELGQRLDYGVAGAIVRAAA